jgi:hypothetical protein
VCPTPQAWVLLAGDALTTSVTYKSSCALTRCHVNQYLNSASKSCVQCGEDKVAPVGSTSVAACTPCGDGMYLPHPQAPACAEDLTVYSNISLSTKWRVFTPASHVADGGWRMDVSRLVFYTTYVGPGVCTGPITPGAALDSGNAGDGWGPGNAWDLYDGNVWGGRPDAANNYYIGQSWGSVAKYVGCVLMNQNDASVADQLMLQAWDAPAGKWRTVRIVGSADSVAGDNYWATNVPVPSPSASSSPSRSRSRSASASRSPTASRSRTRSRSASRTPSKSRKPRIVR